MNNIVIAKIIGIILLSMGLVISSFKKEKSVSIGLLIFGIGFVMLMNNI
jgi:membrane-bound ClpP family serine protease